MYRPYRLTGTDDVQRVVSKKGIGEIIPQPVWRLWVQ